MQKRIAAEEALFYETMLKKEINEDSAAHVKKPLKEKDDNGGRGGVKEEKTVKCSTTDPESDGSVKRNTSTFLTMQWKLCVIKTAGYWIIR